MKIDMLKVLSVMAVAAMVTVTGCGENCGTKPGEPGMAEKAGAAVDRAADKTVDVTKKAATATKDAAGKTLEKTGDVLEKAGSSVEKTGADMQK